MSILSRFVSDQKGDALKSIAASAGIIAFASLALTHLLDRSIKDGTLPHVALVTTPADPQLRMASLPQPTVSSASTAQQFDATPVGTIGGRPIPHIVLDPCSGQTR
jgi:hypothetical protein